MVYPMVYRTVHRRVEAACLPLLLVVMPAAASCASQSAPPLILHVVHEAEACRMEFEGRPVTEDELFIAARSWRGRTVRVVGDGHTPYKCLGGAVYAVQRAGVKKVGFAIEPAKE